MPYARITVRASDRADRLAAHDRIYGQLDVLLEPFLGVGKPTHPGAMDTKFFVDEIADNFLRYDKQFFQVDIDVSIDSASLDVDLRVKHDGNNFDPFSAGSKCEKIKAAVQRIKATPEYATAAEEEHLRFKLKYSLKSEGN